MLLCGRNHRYYIFQFTRICNIRTRTQPISPTYTSITLIYVMNVDGVDEVDVFPNGTYADPPFEIKFNAAQADPQTGNLNPVTITEDFVSLEDFLNNPIYHLPFFRFKVNLLAEKMGAQGEYKNPRIERVIIERIQ